MEWFGWLGLIVTIAAFIAAAVVVPATRRSGRAASREEKAGVFRHQCEDLRSQQNRLTELAITRSNKSWMPSDIEMLQRDSWVFSQPRPLSSMILNLRPDSGTGQGLARRARLLRGLDPSGPIGFSEALVGVAGRRNLTNGTIYRPVGVTTNGDEMTIDFEPGHYFDFLDTGEFLAFDALTGGKHERELRGGDPFDLNNRVASLGVLTLTVILDAHGPTFLMHRRNGADVIVAPDQYHVVPAGEFAPSDIGLAAVRADLDLWRNIMREYNEELLGAEDAQGAGGRPLDYVSASPYREMCASRESGALTVHALGLALDPLTWKPELLTVAVFTRDAFDEAFPVVTGSNEGVIIDSTPFDTANIQLFIDSPSTRVGAKACLRLTWEHRMFLGITAI